MQAQNLNELVQQCSLIVEAEAVHTRSFWADGDGKDFGRNIWTETTFTVKTRFKGTTDVFSIVTLGGQVGDEVAHVSHGLSIGAGWKGLLFLAPAHAEAQKMHGIPGTYRVNELATYYYDILNPPTVFLGKAVDNIEHDILQEIERSTGKNRVVLDPTFTRKGPRKPKNPQPEKPKPTGQLKVDSLPVVTYTIANPQITGTGPFNFEFDLKAHADWDSTRYAKGELWVKYNTGAFGANVAGSGSLLWTEHAFLASGDYTLTAEDVSANTLKFTIDYTGNLGQALLNQLPTQPEPFIHIKLPVYDLMQLADIEFKADSMQEKSKFRADGLVKYKTVIAHDVQVPMAAGALGQALYFTLANMNVTQDGNGDHWFETDIMARCSQDSAFTPFSKICLNYDVNVFANMAFSDNYQIIKAGLSDNPNLDLQDFFSNPAIGLMGIQVYDSIHGPVSPTGYPPDALYIHADARLLCRLRMKIANCNAPANVVFNNPLMESNSAFYAQVPTGWNYFFFDPIEGTNSFTAVVCPDSLPVIYSFFPKTITAGTLDTLTILGANFGAVGPNAHVYFPNADDGGQTMVRTNNTDRAIWTDETIKVTVPSDALQPGTTIFGIAGSGKFKIVLADSTTLTAPDTLKVRFANTNIIWQDTAGAENTYRTELYSQNGNGGMNFYLSQQIADLPGYSILIDDALLQWRCATGVNFKIVGITPINFLALDGVNVIYGLPMPEFQDSAAARTSVYSREVNCSTNTGSVAMHIRDIDIGINLSYQWTVGATPQTLPLDSTWGDLYSVVLHELGHAHLLNHTLPKGGVMHWKVKGGDTLRTLTPHDVEGGIWVVDRSGLEQGGDCFNEMVSFFPQECSSSNSISDFGSKHRQTMVFPNPSSDKIEVVGPFNPSHEYSYAIVDYTGNIIIESKWPPDNARIISLKQIGVAAGFYMLRIRGDLEEIGIKILYMP